jgi:hypothetical protein
MLKEPAEIQIKAVEILENGFSPGYNHHSLPLFIDHLAFPIGHLLKTKNLFFNDQCPI